jgi:hypothetical protein
MKIYTVYNENDPNDSFEVDAVDYEHALRAVLQELGWWIADDPEEYVSCKSCGNNLCRENELDEFGDCDDCHRMKNH